MNARSYAGILAPLALGLLVGGWVLAVVAFFAVGTETCTTVTVPLAGPIEACTDTSATAVVLLAMIGFGSTLGSIFLLGLRYALQALAHIEENTRR